MLKNKSGFRSQLFGGVCDARDTEEMSWLRLSDDYQSMVKLASLLISQYRYNDALRAFRRAQKIKPSDASLCVREGGTCLTLLDFDGAKSAYDKAISLGANKKALAYPLAVREFLTGDYEKAAKCFRECLPCDNELEIAVIYWEIISSRKSGKPSALSKSYDKSMNPGHHTAYKLAVDYMLGYMTENEALERLESTKSDLDFVVAAYGIASHMIYDGRKEQGEALIKELLGRESVWPCISFLAVLADKEFRHLFIETVDF